MEHAERRFFFRHYVEAFSMRYFYLPREGTNYTRDDVVWWSDICFDLLPKWHYQERVENVYQIVHEPVRYPQRLYLCILES